MSFLSLLFVIEVILQDVYDLHTQFLWQIVIDEYVWNFPANALLSLKEEIKDSPMGFLPAA